MKKRLLGIALLGLATTAFAQSNIQLTNPVAEQVLLGNYNPSDYAASTVIDDPQTILNGLVNEISEDSLLSYLLKLESFQTRHASSDTVSNTTGIGAARRWLLSKFKASSQANENRLLTGYLTFDEPICGMNQHRNVFGILPGSDTSLREEVVLVEAHFDSRCETRCDVTCFAPGMDDNGSGTALVLELARVMSQYTFDRTIVFTEVTAEEHGLFGGRAWANYLANNQVNLIACLNNDVIGGIECGPKSSPPSCSPAGALDSTKVRIFSLSISLDSNINSVHKHLARYITLHQREDINPILATPMEPVIEIREDRAGRGGDHIPFRQAGFPAIRFTSQHEHGDGSGTAPDRQHSTNDILGVDLSVPADGIPDSLFVNMGYLKRNSIMNGFNLGSLASSPPRPNDPLFFAIPNGIRFRMQGADTLWEHYRMGIRSEGSGSLDFDSVYTFTGNQAFDINGLDSTRVYHFCVANVNSRGIESMFTDDFVATVTSVELPDAFRGIALLQNIPNPVNGSTRIPVRVANDINAKQAIIRITDIQGREVSRLNIPLNRGLNEAIFNNENGLTGIYTYSLIIDGQLVQSRKMVLAN